MATIRTAIQITDHMSPAFRSMNAAMGIVLNSFESLQNASRNAVDTASIQAARNELNKAESAFAAIDEEIETARQEQERFNQETRNGSGAAGGLLSQIKKLAISAGIAFGGKQILELSDSMTQTTARLNLMNDGLQTTEQLQNMIFQSAQRSRTAYMDTAAAVSKLGILAKDAFSSNEELIVFAELMNKQFKIGGASIQEQTSAMYQLTQAMAAGKLQGDEFRSIMENAPLLAQSIAKEMGKTVGELREMSSQGLITVDVIKNAMFSTAEETNAKFSEIPMTWEQLMTTVSNSLLMMFEPVIQAIGNGAQFIYDHWSIVKPVILALAVAVGIITVAVGAWTVAQWALNGALFASPITWIVLIIIALIAAIYGAVEAMNYFADTSISGTGIIMGVFATAGAFIANIFMGLLQLVFGIVEYFYNLFAAFANFFGNLFNDPIGAVINLFADLADNVLGVLEKIASAMDFIFGSNMADTVKDWRGELQVMAEAAVKEYGNGTYEDRVSELDINGVLDDLGLSMDRFSYSDAWKAGYDLGESIESKLDLGNIVGGASDTLDVYSMGSTLDGIYNSVDDTAANTASMKDSMDVSSEELKYLRDLAEQEAINKFTTAEIKVDMGGITNQVSNETDLDGMVTYLEEKLYESMIVAAEGVHD